MKCRAESRGDLPVALVQLNSTPDVERNLACIGEYVAEAAALGCRLVALPENATVLCSEKDKWKFEESLDGRQVSTVRELAVRHGVHVLLGGFPETNENGKPYNTQVLTGPSGDIRAVYRKIHLFDVAVAADTSHRESDTTCAGPAAAVVAEVEGWRIGLSTCYDLRFPELFRCLVDKGAEVFSVPAAFTMRTGAAHWHVLNRARAVENHSWVIAPAQVGIAYGRRESFGHSLVVDPWGVVVADRGRERGMLVTRLESGMAANVRQSLPCLSHRRFGVVPLDVSPE
ncbi:MAG: carbon-nitrogen hydrolase family protein [Deltaproteobacteria bacterium]|nr:MAG: carbon-nitrogen hydrolase family protein [Deltaproteobacteria bacterium]